MGKKDLLLISSVGFASGWVPSNVLSLQSFLTAKGFQVDILLFSCMFTSFLKKHHAHLLYIDSNIGEWGYSFHEAYFAAKAFGHVPPIKLLHEMLNLWKSNKDIYKSNIRILSGTKVNAPLINGNVDNDMKSHISSLEKDIYKYCCLLESFMEDHLGKIKVSSYEFIGFSCVYSQFFSSLYMARKIKDVSLCSGLKVLFGGPMYYPWNCHAYASLFSEIDYLFVGECEFTLYKFLRHFQNKSIHKNHPLPKVIFSEEKNLKFKSLRLLFPKDYSILFPINFSDFKMPAWLSRGCSWGKCMFCEDNHRPNKSRSPENAVKEIIEVKNVFASNNVAFYEPNINGNYKAFKAICEKIINYGLEGVFWCELNARQTKKEMFHLMRLAGFQSVQIGIESFSNSLLNKMNKNSSVLDNIKSLKWAIEEGIKEIYVNLICNFPGEDEKDLTESLKTIHLIKHFFKDPLMTSICEFELHRQAKIFKQMMSTQKPKIGSYNYFSLMLPEELRGKIPFPLIKINSVSLDRLWPKIVKKISNYYRRPSTLSYTDDGSSIKIIDTRNKLAKFILFKDAAKELFLILSNEVADIADLKRYTGCQGYQIKKMLRMFERYGLIYSYKEKHIGLALRQTL